MSDRATGLGEHEGRYLDDLRERWHKVPADERARLIALATDNLLERPASSTREELLRALGSPTTYADRLRREAGLEPAAGPARRPRSRRRRIGLALLALLVLAIVVGGVSFARWWSEDVVIANACAGVTEEHPQVTVETREAAGASEHVVSYADGAKVSLGMCLLSEARVEVLDVAMPTSANALFQPTGIQMRADLDDPDAWVPFEPFTLDPRRGDGMVFVYVDGRLTDCEHFGEGVATSVGQVTVTYEYHRRRRTTTVPLQTLVTFASPSDAQCPRERDFGD